MTSPLGPASDPLWLLREADRWAEPWKYLLRVRDVPEHYRRVFMAADSQRYALLRFARKAQRTGSVNTSCYDQLVQAVATGASGQAKRAVHGILAGMYRVDRGEFLLRASERHPNLKRHIESEIAGLYARDVRRLGRRTADRRPKRLRTANCFRPYVACDRIAFTMACGWLRGDLRGLPGFCFCSDEVVTRLLDKLLNLPVNLGTVRKLRQRLHLKKAVVLVRKSRIGGGGLLELSDSRGKLIWQHSR